MTDEAKKTDATRRLWPWFLLAAVLLGAILFAVWMWFAVQGVKRIKASSHQAWSAGVNVNPMG